MPNTEESINSTGGIPVISMDMEISGMQPISTDKTLLVPDQAADAKATGDAIADLQEAVMDVSASITEITYPVGSIYMTTSSTAPTFGSWVEIGITATWNQLNTGKRSYRLLDQGESGGTVHFWLRTA